LQLGFGQLRGRQEPLVDQPLADQTPVGRDPGPNRLVRDDGALARVGCGRSSCDSLIGGPRRVATTARGACDLQDSSSAVCMRRFLTLPVYPRQTATQPRDSAPGRAGAGRERRRIERD
jgi:hypothetical protein